jgi:hypothetical protein
MQRIKISSAQRLTGTPGDFRIDFREVVEGGRYRLNEAFICNSYYNVNATNNVLYWTEAGTALTTTVPAGIYSATTLATAVGAAMTTATLSGATFTATYSSTTGKMSVSAAPVVAFTFTFNVNILNSIGPLIGFNGTESNPSAGGALQVNVNPTLSFNLLLAGASEIRDCKSNAYTFIIPIDKAVGAFVLYNSKVNYDQTAELPRSMSMTVRVLDDNGVVIPLLLDWYFVIERAN